MKQYGNMIPAEAALEKVFEGCAFAEGPAADADGNIYFSDCPNNRILVYQPDNGKTEVWQDSSGRANGMNFDAQGRLVTCCDGKDGGVRAVQRYEANGTVTTLASHYNGKLLNAPNDLCFDQSGRIYFTDPRYGDRSKSEVFFCSSCHSSSLEQERLSVALRVHEEED